MFNVIKPYEPNAYIQSLLPMVDALHKNDIRSWFVDIPIEIEKMKEFNLTTTQLRLNEKICFMW